MIKMKLEKGGTSLELTVEESGLVGPHGEPFGQLSVTTGTLRSTVHYLTVTPLLSTQAFRLTNFTTTIPDTGLATACHQAPCCASKATRLRCWFTECPRPLSTKTQQHYQYQADTRTLTSRVGNVHD